MHKESEEILKKIKAATARGMLNDEEATKKLNCASCIFKASLLLLLFFSFISCFIIPQIAFLRSCSGSITLTLFIVSVILCSYPLILKERIRKDIVFKFKNEFWVRHDHHSEMSFVDNSKLIKEFSEFKGNLLRSSLIWYKNNFTVIDGVNILFRGPFLGWVTSILFGSVFGYIYAKNHGEISFKWLIDSVLENHVGFFILWYCIGFGMCRLNDMSDESMGVNPKQRRRYVIALLECAICERKEKEEKTEQTPTSTP